MFFKTCVLKKSINFTGKYLCWSLFIIKLQACNFVNKRLQHRCYLVKFAIFLRTPFYSDCFRVFWKSGEKFSPEHLARTISKSHLGRQQFYQGHHCRNKSWSLMFWRNKDVKRVNSCMTHCSKKSESQTPSGFPENRCSYCLEKNPWEWNYRWIKFRAEDLHHTYCRNLFSNKFANVLVKYFLSVRSTEHYF